MKRLPLARNFLAYSLLTLSALLVASCASNSDSPNTENADTTFRDRQNTQLPPSTNQSSTSTTTEISPTFSKNRTPANMATAVTAGGQHSCALHQNGNISCWGNNNGGQLGNRTETDSEVPVEVVDITDVTAVSAGFWHSCALYQNGTISCWGNNEDGQLGRRTNTNSSVPVGVVDITDATAITTGTVHTCALHQNGTISCWGNNRKGHLGNKTEALTSSVPVEVVGITDATAINAGYEHSCALHKGGTISCWGNNNNGQLGNETDTWWSWLPVEVTGITDATAISAGYWHSCALHQNGTISCWGNNYNGELGNGTNTNSLAPVQVVGITDATAITTGYEHSCALHEGGTISCWGNNENGQLGNGQRGYDLVSSVPVQVVGITDTTAISAGSSHSCALHEGGTISCWGNNENDQLGSGTDTNSQVPVEVEGITDATAINAGDNHSCALREGGTMSCWGNNENGQLGNRQSGDYLVSSVPVQVVDIADAKAVSAGDFHSCALREGGTISCWGSNWGQLGNGQSGDDAYSLVPVEVEGITDATAITTSWGHSCALHQTGTISCWGDNYYGQLGNGTDTNSSAPVQIVDITDAKAVSAGYRHSCALREGGTISCWGNNNNGQLGNRTDDTHSLVPVKVADITDATAITTEGQHSCALREGGTISCWGSNYSGELGNGTDTDSRMPVEVTDITDATAINVGYEHSCALHEDGTISCWGNNRYGQLGNGTDTHSQLPVEVTDIIDATAITTGDEHSCALREGGTVSCWGDNYYGELGNSRWLPQFVVGFGG